MRYLYSVLLQLLFFTIFVIKGSWQISYFPYSRDETRCPGKVVSHEYCDISAQGQSAVHCGVRCSRLDGCVYFVWDSNYRSCRLCETVESLNCSNTETSVAHLRGYARVCENGGWWGADTHNCSCPVGWVGTACQRRIYDCREGYLLGYPDGVYQIQPPLCAAPVAVYCQMSHGGRIHIAVRKTSPPSLLFNRTWQEYRNGFGDLTGDHWLGLHNLYLLSNGEMNFFFRIQLRLKNSSYYQQVYNHFRLSDEVSHYRLQFSSTWRNPGTPLGDSLSLALGSAFSTYDADHDGDEATNCALRHQSGWWFPPFCDQTEGNPLGRLAQPQDGIWSGQPEDVFWSRDLGDLAPWYVYTWLQRM